MKKVLLLVLLLVTSFFLIGTINTNAAEQTAMLSFENKAQRTQFNSEIQVWEQNGIKLTNNKASSTSAVADYANPARFYAGSSMTIELSEGNVIKKIEFTCTSDKGGPNGLKSSIGNNATVSGMVVTVAPTNESSKFVISSFTAQIRIKSLTVYYLSDSTEEPSTPDSSVEFDTVVSVVDKYYNGGIYSRNSTINVDLNNASVKADLEDLVHASNGNVDNVTLSKKTYFEVDALYFEDGHGYGTSNGKLTGINYGEETPNWVHSTLPGMEEYYCTLNDFVLGSHDSGHVDNELDLTEGWELRDGVYSNTNKDVLDAFVLFTAPTWLALTEENYIKYAKATIEEKNNTLVMTLWVLAENAGLLKDKTATNGYVKFSEAVIVKEKFPTNVEQPDVVSSTVVVISDYATANGWVNETTPYQTVVADSYTTISTTEPTNGNNGKYYSNGGTWRLYQTEVATLTISSTKTIASIVIEYNSNKEGVLLLDGTLVATGDITVLATSNVVFTVGNSGSATNGQVRITKITINYAE